MKAVWYTATGPARTVLVTGTLPTPTPAAGEVLVRLHASGVNPSDVKARAGTRAGGSGMPFPLIVPHSDGAGIVVDVGAGVDAGRNGQRVWVWNAQWRRPRGTAAEYIALPAEQAVPLPDGISFAVGASLGIPAMTACHTVLGDGSVAGKTVLISGGAGTVGFLAVQFAHHDGARVIATAHGEPAMARVRAAGADVVLDYRDPDLARRILEANGGRPIDRAVEVEFGANAATLAAVIAENGRIVAYGSARDLNPVLPFYPLMFKAVTLEFALIYLLTGVQRAQAVARINADLAAGRLEVPVHTPFRLEDGAAAHEAVDTGNRTGAVVMEIP